MPERPGHCFPLNCRKYWKTSGPRLGFWTLIAPTDYLCKKCNCWSCQNASDQLTLNSAIKVPGPPGPTAVEPFQNLKRLGFRLPVNWVLSRIETNFTFASTLTRTKQNFNQQYLPHWHTRYLLNNSCSGLLVWKERWDSGFDIYTAEEIDIFTPHRDTVKFVQFLTNPFVLPARLCGAAAGNCDHRYIGKVCSLLLVRADYIERRPRARPTGHQELELLKLLRTLNRHGNTGTTQRLARRRTHGTYFSLLIDRAISVARGPASSTNEPTSRESGPGHPVSFDACFRRCLPADGARKDFLDDGPWLRNVTWLRHKSRPGAGRSLRMFCCCLSLRPFPWSLPGAWTQFQHTTWNLITPVKDSVTWVRVRAGRSTDIWIEDPAAGPCRAGGELWH